MANHFHVLNGDSTAVIFEKSGLPGTTVIWREICCEGPLFSEIDSDIFWKMRYTFFENEYGIVKLDYFDKTIKELLKLSEIPVNSEVVLWFEYDLFCQFNLLGACNLLLQYFRKDLNYYLICVGYNKGSSKMETLSNYSPSALATLYSTKNKLTKHDLAYAKSCWEVLARSNEEEIRQFDFGKSKKFSYLKSAINQHFERFLDANGLNKIDYKILEIVHAKPRTFKEIVRELLLWQDAHTCFGFGDVQYFAYIKKLQKYFYLKENQYFLNHIGKKTYTKNGCK